MKIDLRLDSLQAFSGIRGFACLCVILFHLTDPPTIKNYPFLDQISFIRNLAFIEHGHRWVILFFVLSGFVLTLKYLKGFEKNYLRNRIIRIFPLHWFLIILFLFRRSQDSNRFSDDSLLHQMFLTQSWFHDYRLTWNYPAWTLSSEWFLYLFFFFILTSFRKKIINSNLLLILISIFVGLLSVFSDYKFGDFNIYLFTDLRDFLLGCCLALIITKPIAKRIFSTKLSLISTILLNFTLFHYKIFNLLSFAFVLMICSIYLNQEWIRKFKISKFFGLLGIMSFSLYMIHIYLIETLAPILMPLDPKLGVGIYFIALILFGLLSYQIFEKKIYGMLKKI